MRHLWKCALAAVAFGLTLFNAAIAADDAPPPIREFDLPTIERLGRAMYDQDQFAWKATDALREKVSDLAAENVRGWIVLTLADRTRVRWVRDNNGTLEAAYDVDFIGNAAPVVSTPTDRTLSPTEIAQHKATRAAVANLGQRCYERYNTIVLKDPQGDGWIVWLLGASTEADAVILGGHVRFMVSSDGNTVQRRDALSRSCLVLRKQPNVAGMMASHIVSNTPVETHVFASLNYGLPFFIVTPDGKQWKVEAGKVSKL
jgi:hypothetical protein